MKSRKCCQIKTQTNTNHSRLTIAIVLFGSQIIT